MDENKGEKVSKVRQIATILIYCISGTLLTVMNKLSIKLFPYANLLLFLQNGVTVLLLLFNFYFTPTTLNSLPKLDLNAIKLWIPLVLLFISMLVSSLFALIYVSVPTLIVIRNLSTLTVAVLEYLVLDKKLQFVSIGTLFGMFFGAIFYAFYDLTFHVKGYLWLLVNVLGTTSYQVYVKKIVDLPSMKEIGPFGMSYYNNLISLPILIFLSLTMGEIQSFLNSYETINVPEIKSIIILLLSCLFGFLLSTSAFELNKLLAATSIMVINNLNKFVLIIISEIFVESTLDLSNSIGTIQVLFYGWLYSQTNQSYSKVLFVYSSIIFVILFISIQFNQFYMSNRKNHLLSNFLSFSTDFNNKTFH